ncbi:MAG: hypothetical protein U9Q69_04490 [Nanoarchaeota archaeon]|nr:hypothetical protein [Nanoarchaeota archaeon]
MDFNNFSFIFIGDTHGFINDFNKQKEIIEKVEPDYILCEKLENLKLNSKEDFDKILNSKKISEMTDVAEIKELLKLCRIKKIKMIGIDLKNFGLNKQIITKIKQNEEISKKEKEDFEKILILRERHQKELIKRYNKKTNKPLVIIIGSWHLRSSTPLLQDLQNYVLIYPSINGELIYEPTDKKIIYSIKCQK